MKEALHSKQVVDIIIQQNSFNEFIRLWRSHFIEFNQPKHLPVGWRIDHKIDID